METGIQFSEPFITPAHKAIALYGDGGVIGSNPSLVGGVWAWCAVDIHNERIVRRSGFVPVTETRDVTNNNTELIALVLALEALHDGWSGLVCSDSKLALGTLFQGWNARKQPPNIIRRGMRAIARLGHIETMLLQGHPTKADLAKGVGKRRGLPVSPHNVWCDEACNLEKLKYAQRTASVLTQVREMLPSGVE